jgi:cysteine synthase A
MSSWDVYQRSLPSIAEAIGRTPMVRLNRVAADVRPTIYVKLEYYGPSGSLKDRVYHQLFEQAERRAQLQPGMEVLECSTGNAGAACAFIAAVKGYPCTVVMPEGMSQERKQLIRAYGAQLVFTPGGESDVDLSLQKLDAMRSARPDYYWVPSQFDNPDNVDAHYLTTGPEVWEQTGQQLSAWVAAQGSGGCLTGVGRFLRAQDPNVRIYAVEPDECAILARQEWGSHGIEGIGDGFVPTNLDLALLSGVITVSTDESVAMAQRLAREEGIFCGISSGCNVAAALKLARRDPGLGSIVTLINDTGQRYFSTVLCGGVKEVTVPQREHALDSRSVREIAAHHDSWEILS